jgi:hypothetical protein
MRHPAHRRTLDGRPIASDLHPSHLAEKILTAKTALEGERKQ